MYLFKKPNHERIDEFIESQSRLEFTYPSVGTTRTGDNPSGSLLTTTEFIWERAKPLSMPHAEHCANGSITDSIGSSFTGQT